MEQIAQESAQVPAMPPNMGVAGMEMAWAHSAIYTRMVRDAKRAVSGHELASRTVRSLENIRELESSMQGLEARLRARRSGGAAASTAPAAWAAAPAASAAHAAPAAFAAQAAGAAHAAQAASSSAAAATRVRTSRPVLEPLHPDTARAIRNVQGVGSARRASAPSHRSTPRELFPPVASGSGLKRRQSGELKGSGPRFKRRKQDSVD